MGVVAREGVLKLPPYVAGASRIEGVEKVIKLGSNEAAFGPSVAAMEAYSEAAANLHRYPDQDPAMLRDAIAARYKLDARRVVCGAGSSQLIHMIANIYSPPGTNVVISAHAFVLYKIVTLGAGATPLSVPETAQLTVDVDAMLAAVTRETRIVYLANPNNPTGTMLPRAEVQRLWKGLPDSVLFVLDTAYAEYIDDPDYDDGLNLVPESDSDIIVLRTFSKIYGLGGVRLGWAYAPLEIAEALNRYRPPFSISAPAIAAGIAALGDEMHFERERRNVQALRPNVEAQIEALGLRVTPGTANFTLIHFDDPDRTAADALAFTQSRGLILRPLVAYGLPGALRLTVAEQSEMNAIVQALAEFVST